MADVPVSPSPLVGSVLADIVATGEMVLPSGERLRVSSHIDPACGGLLQRCIAEVGPRVAVEVGLAFGISSLYILEALAACSAEKLIGMDPSQLGTHWRGGGLHNIARSGHAELYEFHEDTSQQVLPKLVARGERIGFGFIDGWHTFDHVLVDFFYVDQMLDVGGIVVFDDVGYPAIRRVCEFVLANRSYEVYGSVKYRSRGTVRERAKQYLVEGLRPFYRTDQTPSAETRARMAAVRDNCFLALRKTGDDQRSWDHFVHF